MRSKRVIIGLTLFYLLMGSVLAQTSQPVQTVMVERGSIASEWTFPGSIEARAEIEITPEVPGRVEAVRVEVGDRVKTGQVLAVIDSTKLVLAVRQAEAGVAAAKASYEQTLATAEGMVMVQLEQARATLAAAETNLQQVKDLAYIRTVSQKEQATAGLEALQANLRKIKNGARPAEQMQAEAAVEQAKASLENARANLERTSALYQQDAASAQTLEGVQTQYKVAEAQYQAALQQLNLVRDGARAEDIEAMEAQVRQAEAGMKLTDQLLETRSWKKDIALAETQVHQAKATLRPAQLQVDSKMWDMQIALRKAEMDQAQVALELAQKQLDDATVRVPVSGFIASRTVEVGDRVETSDSLFSIVDVSELRVSVRVSESDLLGLRLGQEIAVKSAGLSQPIRGTIQLISPTVDPKTRVGIVRVALQPTESTIRPGMYAEVVVQPTQRVSPLIIPRSAVGDISTDQPYVYVVENGHSVRRAVQVGLRVGDRVEILQGLHAGEEVIVSGQHTLKAGEPVHIVATAIKPSGK
ncbi:efflux RND transporter periplasmic adaptor subunit [Candidatus Poribacteria bacterium]|nr:efflux RND transporter periplasmic adaptor subunit [Candidatus Poribacteria bacterium]